MSSENIYIQHIKILSKNSKYCKWYCNIIINALSRASSRKIAKNILSSVEGHHILPKCLCDCNKQKIDNLNIVFVSPREHFILHWLLTKMIKNNKLNFAFSMFLQNKSGNRNFKSFQYDILKKQLSRAISDNNKEKIPWNKGIPHKQETIEKISKSLSGKVPWNKGINPDKRIPMSKEQANKLSSIRLLENNPMSNPNSLEKVKIAANQRSKSICCLICHNLFDPGNFSKHIRKCGN